MSNQIVYARANQDLKFTCIPYRAHFAEKLDIDFL